MSIQDVVDDFRGSMKDMGLGVSITSGGRTVVVTEPPNEEEGVSTALHEAPPVPPDAMYDDDPQLAIPGIDNYAINRIALKIGGTPDLDRSNPDDVQLYRTLKLGQRVQFVVEGYVIDTGGKAVMTADGQVELVHGVKAIKVDTIRPAD